MTVHPERTLNLVLFRPCMNHINNSNNKRHNVLKHHCFGTKCLLRNDSVVLQEIPLYHSSRCNETGMTPNYRWRCIGCYCDELLQRQIPFCKIIIDLIGDMLELLTVIIVLPSFFFYEVKNNIIMSHEGLHL